MIRSLDGDCKKGTVAEGFLLPPPALKKGNEFMLNTKSVIDEKGFVLCPVCGGKTRQKARKDTYLKNLPLFCPKCKCESLIDIKDNNVTAQMAGSGKD